ncbi:hypothetical protein AAE478_000253 [Parahypoxylon ruwenzoriense]
MKFATTFVTMASLSKAASIGRPYFNTRAFPKLANGMYTVPITADGVVDFSHAQLDTGFNVSSDPTSDYEPTGMQPAAQPGECEPQFPTRQTVCRDRTFERPDYVRAVTRFIEWIANGPDDGWIPQQSCKSLVFGLAVVSACSQGGPNPTCRDELVEAMRELDVYCAPDLGGDIVIDPWKKTYGRHNIRDGSNLNLVPPPVAAASASVPAVDGEGGDKKGKKGGNKGNKGGNKGNKGGDKDGKGDDKDGDKDGDKNGDKNGDKDGDKDGDKNGKGGDDKDGNKDNKGHKGHKGGKGSNPEQE